MRAVGRWYKELQTIVLLLLIAAAIGWVIGATAEALTVVLLFFVFGYLWQLRRVLQWIDHPESEPPEGSGIWGMMLDQMYAIQRHNRDARSRLQHTVDYLRDSFRSLRDGALLIDQKGLIEWSNSSAEYLLGLRYPQDKGQNLLSLVRYPEFSSYMIVGDYTEPLTFSTNDFPARHLQVEVSSFGIGDRLILVRDVTQLVQIEQTRQDFVGNVSHELRTPLTVISGYLDTLLSQSEMLPAALIKPLEQMAQQSQRMENLVRDLLWLSKIEATATKKRVREQVDLAALCGEVVEDLRGGYPSRAIEYRCAVPNAKIEGDYRELFSALSNLVVNALKYSPEGKPVSLTLSETDKALCIEVCDQGLGIAEEHIPRLTERFYRVDESRSFAGGGTGLGLAIVKHVAASHEAQLKIESELGAGSCFSLSFHRMSRDL
ncbi:phosphate regulon sensor histidine kinase PhoR [Aequoribacter sp.]|uniref:phosphate regulon sensor histidine kinase PhoR n=1 Tax=Aequoribacter sp. TaxID=2847771 RepID=UPI003F69D991